MPKTLNQHLVNICACANTANKYYTPTQCWFTNESRLFLSINPLSHHAAIKHNFTSLKRDWIFLQPRVLEWKFSWNCFTNAWLFSLFFKPHQIIFIHYKSSNSQLVVDEDDYGKFRLERVKPTSMQCLNTVMSLDGLTLYQRWPSISVCSEAVPTLSKICRDYHTTMEQHRPSHLLIRINFSCLLCGQLTTLWWVIMFYHL